MTQTYIERLAYSHDRNSNVVARENLLNGDFNETCTNDQLNRLGDWQRENGREQVFDMDALGNFMNVATDGVDEERTSNAQNQLTSVEGKISPEYDSSGNMTRDELGQHYISDAWNRLVVVKDEHGQPLMTFAFDALGRRILDNDTHLYFDGTNIIEEQVTGETTTQFVWNPLAINTLVLRDRDADANSANGLEERVYALHNANNDVTAIVDVNGDVLERYVYDPYGVVTFLDANWENPAGSSAVGMQYLFQNGRYDATIGAYRFGAREYRPTIQVWMSEDPVWMTNLYGFVDRNPLNITDPTGLRSELTPDRKQIEREKSRPVVPYCPQAKGSTPPVSRPPSFCGPDISAQLAQVVAEVIKVFRAAGTAEILAACSAIQVADIWELHQRLATVPGCPSGSCNRKDDETVSMFGSCVYMHEANYFMQGLTAGICDYNKSGIWTKSVIHLGKILRGLGFGASANTIWAFDMGFDWMYGAMGHDWVYGAQRPFNIPATTPAPNPIPCTACPQQYTGRLHWYWLFLRDPGDMYKAIP